MVTHGKEAGLIGNKLRWPGRDIDFFFSPRLLFFIRDFFFYLQLLFLIRDFFFLSATFFFIRDFFFYPRLLFYPPLFLSAALFCFVRVKTAGSLALNRAGLRAGITAAAMAGEDREEEEQGAIKKINMLSYLWY